MKWKLSLLCALVLGLGSLPPLAKAQDQGARKSMLEEWNQPFKPFRIIGNIYYVGTSNLACYLIATPGGHILIDTGLQESGPIVRANIEARINVVLPFGCRCVFHRSKVLCGLSKIIHE